MSKKTKKRVNYLFVDKNPKEHLQDLIQDLIASKLIREHFIQENDESCGIL